MDGYRFQFYKELDGTYTMKDALGQFKDVSLHKDLGQLLANMLAEQHTLRIDKSNQFTRLNALIKIAKETDLDKDVLIACINNSGDLK